MPRAAKAKPAAKLKITLVKSLAGRFDKHIATAHSLGLKKIGDTTVQPESDTTKGKIDQIGYLVRIEAAE